VVVTEDGRPVGTVEMVSHTGAHPLMIVMNEEEEILIPLVEEMIVDRQESKLVIDPPPGLLDINRA
jgi:ribosomal 30S subunit maturation factor RimM